MRSSFKNGDLKAVIATLAELTAATSVVLDQLPILRKSSLVYVHLVCSLWDLLPAYCGRIELWHPIANNSSEGLMGQIVKLNEGDADFLFILPESGQAGFKIIFFEGMYKSKHDNPPQDSPRAQLATVRARIAKNEITLGTDVDLSRSFAAMADSIEFFKAKLAKEGVDLTEVWERLRTDVL